MDFRTERNKQGKRDYSNTWLILLVSWNLLTVTNKCNIASIVL